MLLFFSFQFLVLPDIYLIHHPHEKEAGPNVKKYVNIILGYFLMKPHNSKSIVRGCSAD